MTDIKDIYRLLGDAPTVNDTKELLNVHYTIKNGDEFLVHNKRNFKMDYFRHELYWYAKGNRYDLSICSHAKLWKNCIGIDGGINSNYGQYLFGRDSGFAQVIKELNRDITSRRAVTMILGQHGLHFSGIDTPCTVSLQFIIRSARLYVIATMRSQDAIYGLSNDVPAFMFFGKVVASAMNVELDSLHVNVGSLHVYERHYEMLDAMNLEPGAWSVVGVLPEFTKELALYIMLFHNCYSNDNFWDMIEKNHPRNRDVVTRMSTR